MLLIFRTRRLERAFRDPAFAVRLWGADVGSRYEQRLNVIQAQTDWNRLFLFRALNLHPLRGDRAGQFALRLTGRWRLIVQPGTSTNQVRIMSVEDYHA